MQISEAELKALVEVANTNNESAYDLLKRRYSHLDKQELEWAAVKLRRVMDEGKGIALNETPPPQPMVQQQPMRASA